MVTALRFCHELRKTALPMTVHRIVTLLFVSRTMRAVVGHDDDHLLDSAALEQTIHPMEQIALRGPVVLVAEHTMLQVQHRKALLTRLHTLGIGVRQIDTTGYTLDGVPRY